MVFSAYVQARKPWKFDNH